MLKTVPQMTYGSVHNHIGVHMFVLIPDGVAPEQTKDSVTLPAAMKYPYTEKPVLAPYPVSIVLWSAGHQLADFLLEFGSDPLIRVDYKHPFMRGLWNSPVTLGRRIDVLVF